MKKTINRNHVLLQNTVSLMCRQTQRAKTKTNNRNRKRFFFDVDKNAWLLFDYVDYFISFSLLWRYIFARNDDDDGGDQKLCIYICIAMSAICVLSKLATSH